MSRLSLVGVSAVLAMMMLAPVAALGQASEAPSSPRTPWGDPDLQGIWNNATLTPLQRPENLADRAFWTAEEAASLGQRTVERNAELLSAPAQRTEAGGNVGAYNNFWMERGTSVLPNMRTSIIVDPEDGRLPALTPEAERRIDSPEARRLAEMRGGQRPVETWEQLDLGDRCLWYRGIPSFPTGYNNNYHIVQTPGMVAILQEHIHDVRFVPLDGRPHVAPEIRQFAGADSEAEAGSIRRKRAGSRRCGAASGRSRRGNSSISTVSLVSRHSVVPLPATTTTTISCRPPAWSRSCRSTSTTYASFRWMGARTSRRRFASSPVIRGAIGTVTPSWWRRPTSTSMRSFGTSTATSAPRCTSSSGSPGSVPIRSVTSSR